MLKESHKSEDMNLCKEAYCSYEVAKLLKEKGFDEPCRTWYNTETKCPIFTNDVCNNFIDANSRYKRVSAPTHQMAMRWLREVHKKYCDIRAEDGYFICNIIDLEEGDFGVFLDAPEHCVKETYEEAVEASLKYSLENLI